MGLAIHKLTHYRNLWQQQRPNTKAWFVGTTKRVDARMQANICAKLMMRHIGKTKDIATQQSKQGADSRSNSCKQASSVQGGNHWGWWRAEKGSHPLGCTTPKQSGKFCGNNEKMGKKNLHQNRETAARGRQTIIDRDDKNSGCPTSLLWHSKLSNPF